jgi:hypothetical protein
MKNKFMPAPDASGLLVERPRQLIPVVLAAVFAACMGLAPGARAAVYSYQFNDARYFNQDDTANLSGSFQWDTNVNSVVGSYIYLNGHFGSGEPDQRGPVSCSHCSINPTPGLSGDSYFTIEAGPTDLTITFANSLSVGQGDPLTLFTTSGVAAQYAGGGKPFEIATGGADIDRGPAVPELSIWTMMLLGFAGLAFAGRRARGGSRLPA